jgi:hypothetical protein
MHMVVAGFLQIMHWNCAARFVALNLPSPGHSLVILYIPRSDVVRV